MKIVVASKNKAKIEAVEHYFSLSKSFENELLFEQVFKEQINVVPINADSKVSSKPIDYDVFLGTVNRLCHAQQLAPDASFYIAIEGGYFKFNNNYYIGTVASVCVGNSPTNIATGIGDLFQIPKSAFDCVKNGLSLNKIITDLENKGVDPKQHKQQEGILGFLLEGLYNARMQDSFLALKRCNEKIESESEFVNLLKKSNMYSPGDKTTTFEFLEEKYRALNEEC